MKALLVLFFGLCSSLAAPGDLKWTFATDSPIRSSPALATNGWIIFGSYDGNLYAVDPSTGSAHWKTPIGGRAVSSPALSPVENRIVIGVTNGVLLVNGLTGAIERLFSPKVPYAGQAVLGTPSIGRGGEICFVTEGGIAITTTATLDSIIWTNNLTGHESGAPLQVSYCSPTLTADGVIIIGTTGWYFPSYGNILGLNQNVGTNVWSTPVGNWVQSSAALDEEGTIYIGSKDRGVFALNPLTGASKWTNTLGDGTTCSPVIGLEKTLYIGADDGRFYALDTTSGKQKWRFLARDSIHSTPAVAADGTVYFGSYDKTIYALDGRTGALKWSYTTGDKVLSSPLIGPDGTVYIGSYDGKLYAIEGSAPLAETAWPMFKGNPQHTGAASR